jgi:hypothetical protein
VRGLSARSAEVLKCARGPAEVIVDSKALLMSGQSAKLAQERQVLSRILYRPLIQLWSRDQGRAHLLRVLRD